MKHIRLIKRGTPAGIPGRACGECQTSCQSACKTSCTVSNQTCRGGIGVETR